MIHAALQVVLTTRPARVPKSFADWTDLHLQPLGNEQIEVVLDEPPWRLPEALQTLARNPLMLGLIRGAKMATGQLPTTESSLINAYVSLLIMRDTGHGGPVDGPLGRITLEEYALEWLTGQQLHLTPAEFRRLGVSVVRSLRGEGYGPELDVRTLETWVVTVGLAVRLSDELIAPAHKSLLDHLAGDALRRRHAADWPSDRPARRTKGARTRCRGIGSSRSPDPVRTRRWRISDDLGWGGARHKGAQRPKPCTGGRCARRRMGHRDSLQAEQVGGRLVRRRVRVRDRSEALISLLLCRLTLGAGQPYTAGSRPDPSGRRPMSNRKRSPDSVGPHI